MRLALSLPVAFHAKSARLASIALLELKLVRVAQLARAHDTPVRRMYLIVAVSQASMQMMTESASIVSSEAWNALRLASQ